MQQSQITIVVVPRDHFSDGRESLESIYANSDLPFSLIYVDGGSPRHVANYLSQQAARRNFHLIRTQHYLSPNRARNIGAKSVNTPYMVFVDNDVIVASGWLSPLVRCAADTGAAIVSPLTFEGRPLHTRVHFAGGEAHVEPSEAEDHIARHLVDKIHKEPIPTENIITECAEFHCMLVRTETFRRVGGLDEEMKSTRENIDFCMTMREEGHEIYLAPTSKITYLSPERMNFSDIPFFAPRWSDEWDLSSFRHLIEKWDLTEDGYFAMEYAHLGRRRQSLMVREGLLRWLPTRFGRVAERLLRPLERRINRRISQRYASRIPTAIKI
jgi:GT2 family glycosyltransferase